MGGERDVDAAPECCRLVADGVGLHAGSLQPLLEVRRTQGTADHARHADERPTV